MAITVYEKNGKQLYKVYVHVQGKLDRSLRIQRHKFNFESLGEARREEKRLIKAVAQEVAKLEGRGLKWEDVMHRWKI